VRSVTTAGELVARLRREYAEAKAAVVGSARAEGEAHEARLEIRKPIRA